MGPRGDATIPLARPPPPMTAVLAVTRIVQGGGTLVVQQGASCGAGPASQGEALEGEVAARAVHLEQAELRRTGTAGNGRVHAIYRYR